MKKIIVFALSGIGNAILFTPTLIQIRKRMPDFKIILFAKNRAIADIFSGSNYVDKIIIFNNYNFLRKIFLLLKLRKENFDYSITAFPSNKFQFNLLAFFIGAKKRVTHSYKIGRLKTLSFLQNIKISANPNLHDVEQNINLLKCIGISNKNLKKRVFFSLSKDNINFAKRFFNENHLNNSKVIGIHPGCKKEDYVKRWPEKRFIELINKINSLTKLKIILFSGPDEKETVKNIYKKLKIKPIIFEDKNLKNVAGIIKNCDLLLTTDSGLGHIAAALDTPVIAIVGPANYNRTRPYGKNCYVIHPNLKEPLLKYPFYSTSNKINPKKAKESLEKISVEEVYKKIISLI